MTLQRGRAQLSAESWPRRDAPDVSRHASTGPRSIERGEESQGEVFQGFPWQLQRGRAQLSAERQVAACLSQKERKLQRGRAQLSAERPGAVEKAQPVEPVLQRGRAQLSAESRRN